MSLSFSELMAMVLRTLQNPREGAAEVLALGIPREAHWLLVATVAVLSTLVTGAFATIALMRGGEAAMVQPGLAMIFAVHLGTVVMLIVMVQGVGRTMGGTGRVEETTVLMCWLQFVMLVVAVVQSLLSAVMPPIAMLLAFVAAGIQLWLLTHFVAVLHGFRSLAGVFGMIIAVAFMLGFALMIVLQMAGVEFPMPEGAI